MEYKDDPDPGLKELTIQAGRHTPSKSVRTVNKCLKGGGGKKSPTEMARKKNLSFQFLWLLLNWDQSKSFFFLCLWLGEGFRFSLCG